MGTTDYCGRRSNPREPFRHHEVADGVGAPGACSSPGQHKPRGAATVADGRRGLGLRGGAFLPDGQSGSHPEGLPTPLSKNRRGELIGACALIGTFLAMALFGRC
jgi:hypothetical protein